MNWRVLSSAATGSIRVPGDKSISHRALMVASLANGTSRLRDLPDGEDVQSTIRCMKALGVHIDAEEKMTRVRSGGILSEPAAPLDAGNSGTTTRLLSGILAGERFESELTGDASLRRRPMARIIEPLRRMGANIVGDEDRAPLLIRGSRLAGIRYEMPVASAQVKSCLLFAALRAQGETEIVEAQQTRDHTERIFAGTGIQIRGSGRVVSIVGGQVPEPFELALPGDASTAAFFFAAAALSGGPITVERCGVNPTRMGFCQALERMGARVELFDQSQELGEPVADVCVSGRPLRPLTLEDSEIPLLIDEMPLLALLATQADGVSVLRGASELRFKECDRIQAVSESLTAMGAGIEALDDGFVIRGPRELHGATVRSYGDHRIAMMLAVAGTVARGETVVRNAEAAAVSFPQFEQAFQRIGASLHAA